MECGELPKSLLQILAKSLYKDEAGQIYLNVTSTKADCETLLPVIDCDNNFSPESQLTNIQGSDSCGNFSIKILSEAGQSSLSMRTITESDNMLMSDEVIICDSPIPITLSLIAASGSGRERYIKNIGLGTVTIDAGLGVIDSDATIDLAQWECAFIKDYDDNTWIIL